VDGEVVRVLGSRVRPEQKIELDHLAAVEKSVRVSLMLNRSDAQNSDVLSMIRSEARSADDVSHITFLPGHLKHLTSFGAHEQAASGLVILTQDKFMAQKLVQSEQEYLLDVEQAPPLEALKALTAAEPKCRISRQSDRQLRFALTGSQPGLIERLCAQGDIPVQGLRCIRIGRLALAKLPAGQWRYLLPVEKC